MPLAVGHQHGAEILRLDSAVEEDHALDMLGQAADLGIGQPVRHVLQRQRIELQIARDVVFDDQGDVGACVLGPLEGVDPHFMQRQHGGGTHRQGE